MIYAVHWKTQRSSGLNGNELRIFMSRIQYFFSSCYVTRVKHIYYNTIQYTTRVYIVWYLCVLKNNQKNRSRYFPQGIRSQIKK